MDFKPWEVKHPYYCEEGNFFKNGMIGKFETLDEFIREWSDYDMDLNLLVRWDWVTYDDNERNDEIRFFWLMQRKGYNQSTVVKNVKRDEEHARKLHDFLKPRFEKMMELWKPFTHEPTQ